LERAVIFLESGSLSADLPDPGLGGNKLPENEAKLRKAVMAGLTRIITMKLAYNRLISKGLPRNAPPIVEDWEELKARPHVLEEISTQYQPGQKRWREA